MRSRLGSGGNGEMALPGDPPGELEVVDGYPEGGKMPEMVRQLLGFRSGLCAGGDVRGGDQDV